MPVTQIEIDVALRPYVRTRDRSCLMVTPQSGVVELMQMRFSYSPAAGRKPVFNIRSERRVYRTSRPAIVPAFAFFEFTAAADKKQERKTAGGANAPTATGCD
jgi:putative SOS response-associated peptidase YedK